MFARRSKMRRRLSSRDVGVIVGMDVGMGKIIQDYAGAYVLTWGGNGRLWNTPDGLSNFNHGMRTSSLSVINSSASHLREVTMGKESPGDVPSCW